MSNKTPFMYAISLGLALTPICFSTVSAQERCKVSEEATAAKSTYTQQHVLDVGDISGHQIRVFELHRTYPNDKPNCERLKRTESLTHGYSDYVDRNGRAWGYEVTSLENGDKIFAEFDGTSQTMVTPDGSKKSTFTGVTRYTGGTGKYQGVRGFLRTSVVFDIDKNVNQQQTEGEYWLPASTVGQSQK
jgi:hypothetical protein